MKDLNYYSLGIILALFGMFLIPHLAGRPKARLVSENWSPDLSTRFSAEYALPRGVIVTITEFRDGFACVKWQSDPFLAATRNGGAISKEMVTCRPRQEVYELVGVPRTRGGTGKTNSDLIANAASILARGRDFLLSLFSSTAQARES